MPVTFRPLRLALVLAAFATLTPSVMGQTFTWTNFAGGNFSVGTNWSSPPVFNNTAILAFPSTPFFPGPPFQPAGTYTVTADGATAYTVNQMVFNNFASPDVTAFGVMITSNSATGGIVFDGANPSIVQNGTGAITFANGTATNDVSIGASGLTIGGAGIGHVSMAGTIAGTGNLTINQTGTAIGGMGSLVTLGIGNTFVGNTTLNAGNLVLGSATALGPAATNTLIVNGGTVRTNAALTIANPITLNSQMYLTGASTPTFTGAIGGNGGILWQPFTVSTIATFQGAITGTGTLAANGLLPQITLSGSGTALNAANYNLNLAVLALDNSTTNLTRLNAAGNMQLLSSSLTITGNATAASNETVGTLQLEGNGQFTLTPNAAQSLGLTFGTLSRTARDTFQVTTQGTGLTLGGTPGAPGNATLRFNNLTSGSNVNGILPYGFALVGTGTTAAATMVRYDTTNGVVPLNLTTDYATTNPLLIGSAPTTNYRLASTNNTFGSVNNNISVNSLLMETPSTGSPLFGAALFGSGTLSLTSGTIVSSIVGGTTQPTMTGAFIGMNVALGSNPGYFHAFGNLHVHGNITGSGGLVKSGTGFMVLSGDNSGLTGGLTINNGNLFFSTDNNLGAPGQPIVFRGIGQGGGALLNFFPTNQYGPANNHFINISRPFLLGDAGGGVAVSQQGSTMEISGNITGSGRFYKLGAGNLILSGNNTFTGELVVFANTVAVNSAAALGNGSTVILNSGTATTFQSNANITTDKNFLIVGTTAGTALMTNETSVMSLTGQIGGNVTGTPLIKAGSGTLILSNANLLNGAFTIGDSTPTHRAGSDFAQPGGTVVLTGPNGALNQATGYTLNVGTSLILDNAGAVGNINQNRISSSTVTLAGGELRLIGNANGDVVEHAGRTNVAGGGLAVTAGPSSVVTVVQPTSAGGQNTNLVFTTYANPAITANGVVFFRGDNLGGTTGDFTNVTFVAAPTLTNGILSSGLYANSSTANPQDFATTNASNQVIGYSAYTPLPASGGTNTVTHVLTGVQTMTAAQASNALKISNGQLDLNGFNLSITGTGQLLSTGSLNSDAITTSVIGGTSLVFTGASAKFTVNNSLDVGTAALPVGITTASGLTKFGPGELRISSATGVTGGGYNIAQGTVKLLTAGALATNQTVTMAPGAALDISSFGTPAAPVTFGGLAGFGTVRIGSGAVAPSNTTSTTYGGAFEGNGTLVKTTATTLTLNGNSPNFSGDVQILAGTLTVSSNVRPGNGARPGPLGTGTTPVQLGNTTGTSTATLTLGVNLNRFERDIVVPSGIPNTTLITLTMATGQTATITGNITLGRELRISGPGSSTSLTGGALTFAGNITESSPGVGSLDIFGGMLNFWGNNSYSGRTFFEAFSRSIMGIGTDTAFGTGPMVIANQTFTATFRADFGPRTLANTFGYEAGTVANTIGFIGTNNLTFTSPTVDLAGGTRTWDVTSTGITTFTGNLINGNATTALIKNGGGTLVLAGTNNTYPGATTLNQGTLLVNGTLATGAAVTVNTGAILGGTGTINRPITVNTGGTIKPGASPGVLTIGSSLTMSAGSTANFAIQGTTPGSGSGNHSQIFSTSGSTIALGAGVANLVLDFTGASYTPAITDRIVLIDYSTSPGTLTGFFAGLPDDSIAASNVLGSGLDYYIYYGTLAGYANKVVLSPVPEPVHILLVSGVGLAGYRWIRRRKKQQ